MMRVILICTLLVVCVKCQPLLENLDLLLFNYPDYGLLPPDNIKNKGYRYEQHFAHTSDGFYLVLHRIVNPKYTKIRSSVLIVHGLLGASNQFLNNDLSGRIDEPPEFVGPNLGFELAKRGHDVWLTDQRSTPFSANNSNYTPNQREYWEWSNDEIALFTLPALIDYIRRITGRQQIGYIGHSTGVLYLLMLLSKVPKYNQIIKPFIALGPTVFFADSIVNRVPYIHALPFDQIAQALNIVGGPLLGDPIRVFLKDVCALKFIQIPLCIPLGYMALTDGSYMIYSSLPAIRLDRIPVYISASVGLALSAHQAAQTAQFVHSNRAAMTDYDPVKNKMLYGSEIPPVYDMGDVTNPYIALFSARYDVLADPYDVSQLRDQLGVKPFYDEIISDQYFGHLCFVLGSSDRIVPYVIKPVLSIMNSLYPE